MYRVQRLTSQVAGTLHELLLMLLATGQDSQDGLGNLEDFGGVA